MCVEEIFCLRKIKINYLNKFVEDRERHTQIGGDLKWIHIG